MDPSALQGTGLPGGYSMNGGFAATFLQHWLPASSGIPLRSKGIFAADVEAAKYGSAGDDVDHTAGEAPAYHNGAVKGGHEPRI